MEPTTTYITKIRIGTTLATNRMAASFCENP